ncbi:MAG: 3-deoxy-D-manno-octulosonic acid transferase [Desulfobacterales bacterium]|nr:3-deoxy-D-manno-octulosonic acid transferase [Desulfobacterales bacterium]
MTKNAFIPNFWKIYNMIWRAAIPFLKGNPRLAPTFDRRIPGAKRSPADLWIQAASAGEAFLAVSILKQLAPPAPMKVLVTTTTDQGMEILESGLKAPDRHHPNLDITLDRFPFDMPDAVAEAIDQVNPRLMVLLETEIWPALFHGLKAKGCPIFILNARMSDRSQGRYYLTRKFWAPFAPDRVLAISKADAAKYARVFPGLEPETMANIKFEYLDAESSAPQGEKAKAKALSKWLPPNLDLTLLASFRRTEEEQLTRLIPALLHRRPHQVVALFPRHMHRVPAMVKQLKKLGRPFHLKSRMIQPAQAGEIVLWDEFGALRTAYGQANAVFVGASLRTLGGQNFVEALIQGAPTVIGPHWSDFKWVGEEIITSGLLRQAPDVDGVADTLLGFLESPPDRREIRAQTRAYLSQHTGGTQAACTAILNSLFPDTTPG